MNLLPSLMTLQLAKLDPQIETALIVGGAVIVGIIICVIVFRGAKKPSEAEIVDPFERLKHALSKTRGGLLDALRRKLGDGLSEQVLDSVEEILLRTDMGVGTSTKLLEGLKEGYRKGELKQQEDVLEFIKSKLIEKMGGEQAGLAKAKEGPTVILVAGVNGAGKTTSVAKLTNFLASQGHKVLLAASDTFRAAAVEQLALWADRLEVEIVRGQQGADPASVAHDAHEKAVAKEFDYLIIDTAGRLHTEKNLMAELAKIARVGKKHIKESPHEVILVLDATTGQNAVRQAKAFTEILDTTGIFLAKLDGTAKGGMAVVIREELGIPVKFVGLGEKQGDIEPFDATRFVEALFA
ncbi:signal recognition particle-docking protein FtsY [Planctomycetota bacterium]|nr:signal recognition particle-docking protein FtsY [Planctomycetota bacterium]